MKSWRGDMMTCVGQVAAIGITTNGFVKANGQAVMGRGIAKQMADRYPELPVILGQSLRRDGNVVSLLLHINGTAVFSFPVKPVDARVLQGKVNVVEHMKDRFQVGDIAPGWACKASLDIIKGSLIELNSLANRERWLNVYLPRPGCGAGELSWRDVEPLMRAWLDDRFHECTFK